MEDIIKEIEEEVRYCHKLRHLWHSNIIGFHRLEINLNWLRELTNIQYVFKGDFNEVDLQIRAYLKKVSDNFNLECHIEPHNESKKWSYGNDYNKKEVKKWKK
jgi:hypothetical protein